MSAKLIKDKMNSKIFKLTGKDLLVLVRYKRMVRREINQYPGGWQLSALGGTRQSTMPLLVVAPTILTTKKRRTSMTRRGGRWAQLD